MIIAGEPSGDGHGAKLVNSLQDEGCEFYGMGGKKMAQSGVKLLENIDKTSVMDFAELITKLPFLYKTLFQLKHSLKRNPPDLLILVDFQAFNFKLAKFAKKIGVKTLFYIGPQVWAWRTYRVKKLKKVIDYMAVIFPFEVDFYQKHNMQVSFVGHPLIESIQTQLNNQPNKAEFLAPYNLNPNKKIIGFLPGSRSSEIINHLPIFIETIKQLTLSNNYEFLLSRYQYNRKLAPYFDAVPKQVKIIDEDFYPMLLACDFVVAASGTASLEAALLKVPILVLAKTSNLSYFFYKRMIKIPFISIVNIILSKQIIIELIQNQANAKNICWQIERVLSNQTTREEMQLGFTQLWQKLSVKPNQNLKALVLKLLNNE